MLDFNYELAINYFKPRTFELKMSAVALIISVICFMTVTVLGIVFLILGLYGLKLYFDRPSIGKLNEEIQKVEKIIINKATETLGVDIEQCKVINPVLIKEFDYITRFNTYLYNIQDNIPSVFRFVVLLFTKEQVLYYDYSFSLISREENVGTGEYFYRDIVAFNTSNKTLDYVYNNINYKKNYQEFVFSTTGGIAFACPINSSDNNKVQGMRNLLREKKNAMV